MVDLAAVNLTKALELCAEADQRDCMRAKDGGKRDVFLCKPQDNPETFSETREKCIKLLVSFGARVKYFKISVQMWIFISEEESVKLLHAAGFMGFTKKPMIYKQFAQKNLSVPPFFQYLNDKYYSKMRGNHHGASVQTLMEIVRDVVRMQMIENRKENLFSLVPELPLPKLLHSFLLYDTSL